jgi:hypothetical protein
MCLYTPLYILLPRTGTHVHLHPGILLLRCMRTHTPMYVSLYSSVYPLASYTDVYTYMQVSSYALILIYVCLDTPSSWLSYICVLILLIRLILLYVCPHTPPPPTCVLILLYICPHTPICVSSHSSSSHCVLILIRLYTYPMCPHTPPPPTCVLILLLLPHCPHTHTHIPLLCVLILVHTNSRVSTARQKSFSVSLTTVR